MPSASLLPTLPPAAVVPPPDGPRAAPAGTARFIARALLVASREPRFAPLLSAETGDCCRRLLAAAGDHRFAWAVDRPGLRAVFRTLAEGALPGITLHYLARKRCLEDWLRRGCGSTDPELGGCQQVVVLGAGLDSLAWRFHRAWPGVRFFELDRLGTMRIKARAMPGTTPAEGGWQRENLTLIPADLAVEMLGAALGRSPGFAPDRPTLFLAEGLLMYLPPVRVQALLGEMVCLGAETRSFLAFSFMESRADGRIGFRRSHPLVGWWLRRHAEPFLWSVAPERLAEFLAPTGWRVRELVSGDALRAGRLAPAGLADAPLALGEWLALAQGVRPAVGGSPPGSGPVLVNDVHSRLNPTRVTGVTLPSGLDEIQEAVRDAARAGAGLSVCGGRHAMGGQQFGAGTQLMDLSRHAHLHYLDAARGLVKVDAGIRWPALVAALHALQARRPEVWSIRQKQTGADELSLGGALAANVHGRGLTRPPIVADVRAFTLVDAAGAVHRCSRRENPELFKLAIGGYGAFGIVADVTLRLARRHPLERRVVLLHADELGAAFAERIAAGYEYGDFQFNVDERSPDFLRRGVFSCYRPVAPDRPVPAAPARLDAADWRRLLTLAHTDRRRGFAEYCRYYLATDRQLYWSDTHQMTTYVGDYHADLDRQLGRDCPGSEMITELFVPRARLADFLDAAAETLRERSAVVIYGTVRLVERDRDSFLAWARESFAGVVLNLHVDHAPAAVAAAAAAFRALIDLAVAHGGSFYPTYHRWATREQWAACYPQLPAWLALQRRHDPAGRWQNDWLRHVQRLGASAASPGTGEQTGFSPRANVDAVGLVAPCAGY